MLDEHSLNRVFVLGKSCSGKTTYWINRIKSYNCEYIFVYDPELQFARKVNRRACCTPEECFESAMNKRLVIFDPYKMFGSDQVAGLNWFAGWVLAFCSKAPGVKVFGVDEIQRYVKGGASKLSPEMQDIWQIGRRYGIDCLVTSNSPSKLHSDLRLHLTELVCFRFDDAFALAWLKKNGVNPNTVKNLKYPGGFISEKLG